LFYGLAVLYSYRGAAGFTYCAIGALSFLDRLSTSSPGWRRVPPSAITSQDIATRGLSSLSMTLHWLVSRQTTCLEENEYYSLEDQPVASVSPYKPFHVLGAVPVLATDRHPDALAVPDLQELQWAGFNGRCNKNADTCYSWWVGGSLAVSQYQSKTRTDLLLTNAQDTAQSASYGLQWQSEIFVGEDAAHRGRFWQASR